jgi:hypothetical protein
MEDGIKLLLQSVIRLERREKAGEVMIACINCLNFPLNFQLVFLGVG